MNELAAQVSKVVELALWAGEDGGASAIASLNLMDGFNTYVTDNIASIPAAQQVSTGAYTTGNVIGAFDNMVNALPADVYHQAVHSGETGWAILTAPLTKRTYDEAYRTTFGANTNYRNFTQSFIEGTNIQIIPVNGLQGLNNSLLVRLSDLWIATDIDAEWNNFVVERGAGTERRKIFIDSQFKLGTAIQFIDQVVTDNY